MKKIIIGGVIVILLAVAFVLINKNSPLHEKDEPITITNSENSRDGDDQAAMSAEDNTPSVLAGQYVDYSDTVIATTPGTKLLFFHAPWCPQCRELETNIRSGVIPADVSIIKVDYDSNQQLREKYGVTLQTTIVKVDDTGNLVSKYVAYDEPNLEAITKNLL